MLLFGDKLKQNGTIAGVQQYCTSKSKLFHSTVDLGRDSDSKQNENMLPTRKDFEESGLVPITDPRAGDNCLFCLHPLTSPVKTSCGHIVDLECAKPWLDTNNTCPRCRTALYEPSEATPPIPYDMEGIELNIELDTVAIVRSFNVFEGHMQVMDDEDTFIVPEGSQVLMKHGTMILTAAGAAIWLKPNIDGDPEEDVCRQEWIKTVDALDEFLAQKDGWKLNAGCFKALLHQTVWDEMVWQI